MTDKKKNSIQKRVIQGAAIVIFVALIMRVFDFGGAQWLDEGLGADGEFNAKYQTLRSLALVLAGLVGLLGWLASNQRANAMTDSVDAQVKDNENKTFHEAIKHLGDSSASVRLGGIYALYDLALSKPKKRLKNIIEILSAHVRTTTQGTKYQEDYPKKPSDEISSLLKLLSNLNTNYLSKNEEAESSPLDLSHAYLCGVILQEVDFRKAFFICSNFKGASLKGSHFESADLEKSHFEGADLVESHFEGAFLEESHFEGADLEKSHFEGAYLEESHFEGAYLGESHFEGADLVESHFEGASLQASHFESAFLMRSHFEGTILMRSHFEGAFLMRSHFEGANFHGSYFEGASDNTKYNFIVNDRNNSIAGFKKRILGRIGKEVEIKDNVFFAGGIKEDDIKDLEKRLENTLPYFTDDDRRKEFKERMEKVIESLKPHQGRPISRKIPEHLKGSISLGELTKEKADEIIQLYEEVMKIHDEIKKKHK